MTITWTKTAGALSAMAAQRVQMLGTGQTLTGHRWDVWRDHMNGFLKLLQTQGPTEWREAEQLVDLVQGQAAYVLDPRPYRVQTMQFRDASGREMPMTRWNRDQYRMVPYKTQQGTPVIYMVTRPSLLQMAVTIWSTPNAAAAAGALVVGYDRVIEDVVDPASVIDLPQEWIDMVADITGVRLAASFNLNNPAVMAAKERADSALIELLGDNHDESVIFTVED